MKSLKFIRLTNLTYACDQEKSHELFQQTLKGYQSKLSNNHIKTVKVRDYINDI